MLSLSLSLTHTHTPVFSVGVGGRLHVPKTGSLFATTVFTYICRGSVMDMTMVTNLTLRLGTVVRRILPCYNYGRLSQLQRKRHDSWFHDPLVWPVKGLPDADVVMLVRDPTQRVLSAYHHLRAHPSCCMAWGWPRGQTASYRNASLSSFLRKEGTRGCQTKMILGQPCMSDRTISAEEIERATRFVERYAAFVGLTDHYLESVCLWHARFGGPVFPEELVAVSLTERDGQLKQHDLSQAEHFIDEIDERVYRTARRRFMRELQARAARISGCRTRISDAIGFRGTRLLKWLEKAPLPVQLA